MLENKPILDISNLIVSSLESELNQTIPLLPKAFNRIIAKILSGVFIILYKKAQWMFLQWFVEFASFDEVEIADWATNTDVFTDTQGRFYIRLSGTQYEEAHVQVKGYENFLLY